MLIFTCVNVTNLLLSRASIRSKEMAVRASLGAGRVRLFRQLLTESLLLSGLGAIGGGAIGLFLMSCIEKIRLPGIEGPLRMSQPFDWRMFLFIGSVAAASGLLAGVVPAFRATRLDLNDTLRESGRSLTGGAGHNRIRNVLVVGQAAGSLVALIMAGLFLRSLQHAEKADLGFQPEHLMNLTIDVGELGYDEQRGANFYRELGSRVRALPGVQSAAFAYAVPLGYYSVPLNAVWNESQRGLPASQVPAVSLNKVDSDYFRTMGIEIVRGRAIDERDQSMTPLVAVVNELFAQQLWPGQDPIGHHFRRMSATGPDIEVVGVAKYSKYASIGEIPAAHFYVPLKMCIRDRSSETQCGSVADRNGGGSCARSFSEELGIPGACGHHGRAAWTRSYRVARLVVHAPAALAGRFFLPTQLSFHFDQFRLFNRGVRRAELPRREEADPTQRRAIRPRPSDFLAD